MGKWSMSRWVLFWISMVSFGWLVVLGLNLLVGWDFNKTFTATVFFLVSTYLVIASNIKNFKSSFGGAKKTFHGVMNMLMFAVGILLFYIGIITLPFANALAIPVITKFTGWIVLTSGVLALGDSFHWV